MTGTTTVQNQDDQTAPEVLNPNRNPDDPDVAALLALEQAEKDGQPAPTTEEDTGQPTTEGEEGTPTPGQAPADGETPPAPAAKPAPVMIPKARLDAVLDENRQLREGAARLMGRLEAVEVLTNRQPASGNAPQPEVKAPTAEERIATLRAEQVAFSKRADIADVSFEEYEAERQRIDDEIWAIRQDQLLAKVPAPAAAATAQPVTDLYREERINELEAAHPYAKLIPDAHPIWDTILYEADAAFRAEGRTLDPKNPADDLAFKAKVAELTDVYGPLTTGRTPEQVGLKPKTAQSTGNGQTPPAPPPKPKPSQAAIDRGKKLDLAETLPPDISKMGGAPNGNDMWTEDRVAHLTEEEWEALPQPTKDALDRRYGDRPST